MRKKKELTEAEKRDLAMKYEVAEELGLLEKVERCVIEITMSSKSNFSSNEA